ncbi:bifunctional UDP-N-acetylglucosamine diphosphorylase/glucosamine-1-phosphate N-acetyltransferase GlmU [Aliarcobacter cibarius]|jgi:bifunctional UDP-N-acetylglucosamine pyrophosphorylase / glucosamine-1-phosphate N-acetyltransferase|uniref:Bifunctional protein GlmU n=1 Tax=Aliarcobacter cibarius TaxID=255507 RepID=A0A5J6REV1_9BACT|nr:bifunctional UDP-N-acetylglucosamine diphosphorylase/glucosamine-1-phosphate N-acetyltransferase GlmU [Aliarcobacter cibarius]QEZ88322.1 fused N-acetylglucosamine-1-phosphate uridyltransferase and glucosamine-1-phosphate acetyltransferase [Aliarcobacter cibarius]QKJ26353.1 fused N-acetylglucosamine-1-phosphate uridyltransferase and glucosamine-1-phosphate acetyltransferase [Aliarcobacter cibarius]TLT01843.1 bifunctional UDP-N-acetylglucosamine diphosphorylase/glucosamine-1-phosphate N-acetylt
MFNKSIIILAAGQGTRMKSDTPKVLHKISGKPMLYYSIKEALKLSDDITVVLYHQFEKVKAEIEKYFTNINFVIQDHKNYPGTGGAVMGITPKYGKVLVLNGDMPLIQASELEKFDIDATIVMSVLELESADGYGRVIIENGNVKKIVEQKDASIEELKIRTANAGIYQFCSKFLLENLPKLNNNNAQKEYYITDLVEMAINQGKVLKPLIVNEENFKGVNSKVELADAEVIHQNRIKKEFLRAGVIMRLPDTIYIEEGVVIEGESIIENGVSILGNSKIINSHIKTNSVVEDSVIIDSDVGPMARIRPASELNKTHIGNFVETKKAKLNGVKAGHLSYLGDCSINEGTNIGCGTITCNYDGVNKHQTIIGKNVFVGSDTQFVAPVTVEDDVLIGAGSCVTGNVKKGELYLTRAKVKTIDGYFYKHFESKKK